jgi:hypothetical protein
MSYLLVVRFLGTLYRTQNKKTLMDYKIFVFQFMAKTGVALA